MLTEASPTVRVRTDPRVPSCQACPASTPRQHTVALEGMLATSASTPQVHQAHLLPLFHRQVGRAQGAHTTNDPSQDRVAEVLPDWVVELLGLLSPDLSKLLVEQGCFLLWAPEGIQGTPWRWARGGRPGAPGHWGLWEPCSLLLGVRNWGNRPQVAGGAETGQKRGGRKVNSDEQ